CSPSWPSACPTRPRWRSPARSRWSRWRALWRSAGRGKLRLQIGDQAMPGKRIQLDDETWRALDLLARDSMRDFQELADEAFRDLLRKHGRPTDLKTALRQSAGAAAEVVPLQRKGKPRRRSKSA